MASNHYSAQYDEQQKQLINDIFQQQKIAYQQQPYPQYSERITKLQTLKQAILSHQTELIEALAADFNHRSSDDSKLGDILPTIMGINYAIKHLKGWLKPAKRQVGILFQPAKAQVVYQPLGVVGIVTPWNYPIFLALGPLTTAIAAGNQAMIKLSEFTPATNKVIINMLAREFEPSNVAVFDGGPDVAAHFTNQAFDHLLFTGSTRVGKLVMAAAAKNLTPVTLELGGKSPVIIDPDINLEQAVNQFILAKTLNAGQTCVAPDYILCPQEKITELITICQQQFTRMYPNVQSNSDYSHIINDEQFQRLQHWLIDAQQQGAIIHTMSSEATWPTTSHGEPSTRLCPLLLVSQVTDTMLIMQQEIFGPILPIIGYQNIDEAINYINQGERPLALYLCSYNKQLQQRIVHQTHSGGVCINDAAIHVAQDDLPFGGIGPSGMGQYHGQEGFYTFSKAKSVLTKGKFNGSKLAFPPYNRWIHKMIYRLFLR